ncbi:MAG: extracellular solute-binding protein [Anaerovoracaceae bacterium]|nr:extracellular solute-binding protein [Anaerovoracaceae bacterium]
METSYGRSSLMKKIVIALAVVIACTMCLTGCGSSGGSKSGDSVIIYTNADEEAMDVMKKTLDDNGFKGEYEFKTFGTSELGGKLMAEGSDIEADMIGMSSFYVDSSQDKNDMFTKLDKENETIDEFPDYYTPYLANQGSLFYNTEEVEKQGLTVPKSIKDLAKSEYKGKISVPDISGSSTAWLMIQALISTYGEDETKTILKGIYANAGDNLEDSGSGPIKKVRSGEAAIGFGLRHQAIKDKEEGKPIDYIDPSEGDYTLNEGIAIIDHGDKDKVKKAQEMMNCIISKGRPDLMEYYPIALYKGEKTNTKYEAPNSKTYKEPLTVDLLKKHMKLSEECK